MSWALYFIIGLTVSSSSKPRKPFARTQAKGEHRAELEAKLAQVEREVLKLTEDDDEGVDAWADEVRNDKFTSAAQPQKASCPTGLTQFEDGGHQLCSTNGATNFVGVTVGWGDVNTLSPGRVCSIGPAYVRAGVWNMFSGANIRIQQCQAVPATTTTTFEKLSDHGVCRGSGGVSDELAGVKCPKNEVTPDECQQYATLAAPYSSGFTIYCSTQTDGVGCKGSDFEFRCYIWGPDPDKMIQQAPVLGEHGCVGTSTKPNGQPKSTEAITQSNVVWNANHNCFKVVPAQ